MKKEQIFFIIILGITFIGLCTTMIAIYLRVSNTKERNTTSEDGPFTMNIIKESNKIIGHNNYMISPYSIEIALSMLREGTASTTKEELEKTVPKRSIKDLSVEKRVNVANAIFIKDIYRNDLKKDFENLLLKEYNAKLIMDDFKTPEKVNKWVNKETRGMIPKILEKISPDYVMGIGNAIAMEEEWMYPFECENTQNKDFHIDDKTTVERAMMIKTFESGVSYYEDETSESIIMPYKIYGANDGVEKEEGEQLEFIGILPKDMDDYINNLTTEKIEEIEQKRRFASSSFNITVTIPKFEFEYDFKSFKKTLNSLGIEKVFSPNADFSAMLKNHNEAIINSAVHKTYIKVEESGTKAAAVTYFDLKDGVAVQEENEYISITFDKPFIFIIKDTKTNEVLFFGTVYDPKWNDSNDCK